MKFFRVQGPHEPWGDFGRVLVNGMAVYGSGMLELERTGPWIPPISFPGTSIVVTDEARRRVEASSLTGVRIYRQIVKRHIARLDWHAWPQDTVHPPEVPSDGISGNYILDRPHDPDTADALGTLWHLELGEEGRSGQGSQGAGIVRDSWGDSDLFRLGGTIFMVANERAGGWLVDAFGADMITLLELTVI